MWQVSAGVGFHALLRKRETPRTTMHATLLHPMPFEKMGRGITNDPLLHSFDLVATL